MNPETEKNKIFRITEIYTMNEKENKYMKIDFEYGQGTMAAELPDNTDIFIPGETVKDPDYIVRMDRLLSVIKDHETDEEMDQWKIWLKYFVTMGGGEWNEFWGDVK